MAAYEYPDITPKAKDFIQNQHTDTYPFVAPTAAALPAGFAVFISGASKGVGRACAISYAQAGAARIALGARSSLDEVKQATLSAAQEAGHKAPEVLALKLDVQDRGSVTAAADAIGQAFGKLDVVVNNAGYLEAWQPLADSDPDEWWRTWDVNIRGVYEVTRALLPLVLKSEGKTILSIGSNGAHNVSRGASAYQASKFALMRFSEFICREYAEQGVLAYTVHPGGIKTELAQGMPQWMHAILVDTPELAGDSIVFLTRERRTWLAGRFLNVKWDLPELFAREKEIVDGDKLKMRMVM